MEIAWQFVLRWFLRILGILACIVAGAWVFVEPGFEPILAFLGGIASFAGSFLLENEARSRLNPQRVHLYEPECGNHGINLADQRLLVSSAFGTYFSGLLERDNSHTILGGQIDAPVRQGQESLEPIQRIFWELQYAKGGRVLVIAGEGGMGKSTLATKIVRCLFTEQTVDLILGDSAKVREVQPIGGKIIRRTAGYYSVESFYERLSKQLGLPPSGIDSPVTLIRDRLLGRRAIIIVDNLETVSSGDELLESLRAITNRDIRAIVTTRTVNTHTDNRTNFIVRLNPLADLVAVRKFLEWHIRQYQNEFDALTKLKPDLNDSKRLEWLVDNTGGIPLLIQLVFSDVARYSWSYLNNLPNLYGSELLDFLYEARWQQLSNAGRVGMVAQGVLRLIEGEQYQGKPITFKRLTEWAENRGYVGSLPDALDALYERFLIINHDSKNGNFTIFPSLAEFVGNRR